MTAEIKTLKIICAECQKSFTVRFPVIDEAAEGRAEEVVVCLYCQKPVKIPLEKKYMKPGELIRSLKVDQ